MLNKIREKMTLVSDQQGLSTVEYIIILGLVAVLGITTWKSFGTKLTAEVGEAETAMDVVGQTP